MVRVKRTLLIDTDIIAYQVASACQRTTIDLETGKETHEADEKEAFKTLAKVIKGLERTLESSRTIMCLTDAANFRKEILPSYKANRKDITKPVLLGALRAHVHQEYETFQRPSLEADDVMGILQTIGDVPGLIEGERVIVSEDKDMKQIPGLLFNPGKPQLGVKYTGENGADYVHLYQTLIGDTTDNYKGCPRIGPKKAELILAPWFSHGENRHPDPEWKELAWRAVVTAFEGKGLTEADALVQAQVARICRSEDYSFESKQPIPWTPVHTRKKAA